MGRGSAGTAKGKWPGIHMNLGHQIRANGNRVYCMTQQVGGEGIVLPAMASIKKGKFYTVPYHVVSFPTKPESCRYEDLLPYYQGSMKNTSAWDSSEAVVKGGDPNYPGWMARSDLSLIERSARQLAEFAAESGWKSVVLPRPGCGAGELSWDEVRPVLSSILDDRFYAITFER